MADSKNTDAYLLGHINANVEELLKNQATIRKDLDEVKKTQAYYKGVAAAFGVIGGGSVTFLKQWLS